MANYHQGEFDEGCMNVAGLNIFLERLQKIICHSNTRPFPEEVRKVDLIECFGNSYLCDMHRLIPPRFLILSPNASTLSGLSFLYTRWSISDQNSMTNLSTFIDQDEARKYRLFEIISEPPPLKKTRAQAF